MESADSLVLTALRGLTRVNPSLSLDPSNKILFLAPKSKRVHLISGGGSGHEPAHAGFVGSGMLDAAVCGQIFASPSSAAISAGIEILASGGAKVLVIVKNYTGDRLHFGIAVEGAKRDSGRSVELVVVADDVSVGRAQGGRVGRRGLAGTVLVHKVSGAAAIKDLSLRQVKEQAQEIIDNLVTVGASLSHAHVPGSVSEDTLKGDELELGMGIHNEPGFKKLSPIPAANKLAALLLTQLLDQNDKDRAFVPFKKGDHVVLLVNNLGGLSNLEVSAFTQTIYEEAVSTWGLTIKRVYSGTFMTSLDGAGISITFLNLSNCKDENTILEYLDLPTTAPGWSPALLPGVYEQTANEISASVPARKAPTSTIKLDPKLVESMILGACNELVTAEPEITKYDTITGDGDCGQTLKQASEAIRQALSSGKLDTGNAVGVTGDIASILEAKMGGTSGALYTIYFSALSSALASRDGKQISSRVMGDAGKDALERLQTYTTATTGDKTLLDALIPFVEALVGGKSLALAVSAAQKGAEGTKDMNAGLGRATYVAEKEGKGVPDPGAVGVWKLVAGLLSGSQ